MTYLKILNKIPRKVSIGLSGGVDSMVLLDFLLKGGREVTALHFNHGTEKSSEYEEFVVNQCKSKGVKLVVGTLNEKIPKKRSREDFWREKRYEFFNDNSFQKVITCHHLDDAVETWVFSSIKGTPKLIPYERKFIIRPLLLNKKSRIYDWADQHSIEYIFDKSNDDVSFDRNYIRNIMMPHILKINPGIYKNIRKKIISKEITRV